MHLTRETEHCTILDSWVKYGKVPGTLTVLMTLYFLAAAVMALVRGQIHDPRSTVPYGNPFTSIERKLQARISQYWQDCEKSRLNIADDGLQYKMAVAE